MNRAEAKAIAESVIFLEALHLDRGNWLAWTQMYESDAEYWMPSWRDEYTLTNDPNTEVSLIYHASRRELEERVSRIESRKSVTALPLPRTVHHIGNVIVQRAAADLIETSSAFSVHVYDARVAKHYNHVGHYEHALTRNGSEWCIKRKKIILINDRIPALLDFYSI